MKVFVVGGTGYIGSHMVKYLAGDSALAALSGKSIKTYVLERVLPDTQARDDDKALSQLESFLEPRLKAAHGTTIHKSVEQVFEETYQVMQ